MEVWITPNQTLKVANIYIPPGAENDGEMERLWRMEIDRDWIVGGDFNAHHDCWDTHAANNDRGDALQEWAEEKGLVVLNDGEPTRRERGTTRQSAPDVTLCSRDSKDC